MTFNAVVWGVIGFLLTVMVLSYLVKDSLFFRLAEIGRASCRERV